MKKMVRMEAAAFTHMEIIRNLYERHDDGTLKYDLKQTMSSDPKLSISFSFHLFLLRSYHAVLVNPISRALQSRQVNPVLPSQQPLEPVLPVQIHSNSS
jgi:hypothetical protein